MAHAVQIYNRQGDKFVINTAVLNPILDEVGSRPVAVYSLCGPLRKGKSFMLSMWLRYLVTQGRGDWVNHQLRNMFTYRAGADRETTGIYMWSEPFIFRRGSDGKEVALLLLDSQGSFDNQTTTQENAIVFALCTLLSSHVVYNLQGQISEDLLQFIQYFGSYARLADEDNKDEPFQKLMFLIRDFQHECDYSYGYYDDDTSINGKNYKKDYLNPKDDHPPEVNFVHEMILDTFSHVGVYLMPHPGLRLANKGEFNIGTIEPDFLNHLKKFVPFMLQADGLAVKKIGGQVVTGEILKTLVNKWAVLFKTQTMPEAKTIHEATSEIQHEMAKQAAIDNYSRRFKEFNGYNKMQEGVKPGELLNMHKQILDESIKLFHSFKKMGSKEMSAKYLEVVIEEIQKHFEFFKLINESRLQMQTVIKDSDAKVKDMKKSFADLTEKLEKTDANNKAERERLEKEIADNDRMQRKQQEIRNAEIQALREQVGRQQKDLEEERRRGQTGGRRGDSGILGILGGLAEAVVNLADVVMAGSVLKNAWKKF